MKVPSFFILTAAVTQHQHTRQRGVVIIIREKNSYGRDSLGVSRARLICVLPKWFSTLDNSDAHYNFGCVITRSRKF